MTGIPKRTDGERMADALSSLKLDISEGAIDADHTSQAYLIAMEYGLSPREVVEAAKEYEWFHGK